MGKGARYLLLGLSIKCGPGQRVLFAHASLEPEEHGQTAGTTIPEIKHDALASFH
jgi:hypothetical protein